MTGEHLSDTNCATPANIVGVSDLNFASLALMQTGESQECLDLLKIFLQKGCEPLLVAEP